ncbi:MAG: undecaprenyl-diphosphate phosphatase [Pyrobaculum sp.]
MDLALALLLGVIQGVAEWFPISSKTQIMLTAVYLADVNPAYAYSLGLFLESASVIAVLLYYRRVYLKALMGLRGDVEGRRWLLYMAITTAVTGAVGVPLYLLAREALSINTARLLMAALGVMVIANALLLQRAGTYRGLKRFDDMSIRDMALVGLAQALSALPGVSRSGATTATLLLLGYSPAEAFKASFVLAPIAGLGAAVLAYSAERGAVATAEALLATAVGVVVSLATIRALLEFARSKHVVLVNLVVGILAAAGALL